MSHEKKQGYDPGKNKPNEKRSKEQAPKEKEKDLLKDWQDGIQSEEIQPPTKSVFDSNLS